MSEAGGQGGRYNRSFEGLVGAIIIVVVGVVGFVVFRSVFSDPPVQEVPQIDYLAEVRALQETGAEVVYPVDLPDGWQATAVRPERESDERPRFELNFFTGDEEFVGLRKADADVDDLLEEAGVEDATEGDPLTGVGELASTWTAYADPDGDRAYAAEVGGDTVLVYGSVGYDALADLLVRLTSAPA